MSEMMKAARLHQIGQFQVDEVPVPVPQGEQLLVKIGACGVCGADLPRIYEHGTSNQHYPMAIGHEFSGQIVAGGEDADPGLVGRRGAFFPLIPCRKCDSCLSGHYAMCEDYDYMGSRRDGGFAQYCLVPSKWHFVESKNPDISYEALAMMEPACVAQHAVLRKSEMFAGANVVIFGAGPIGILAGRGARIAGAGHILMVDVVEEKCDLARQNGFEAFNSRSGSVEAAARKAFDGKLADICVEGSGFSGALETAIRCITRFGTITQQAHSLLLGKEVVMKGIGNSHYGNVPINEWKYTAQMMDAGVFTWEDLISHTTGIDGLPALIDQVKNREVNACKVMYSARED